MESCLSSESRSHRAAPPMSRKRRSSKKGGLGSRNSSFDYGCEEHLHRTPGRTFLNGSTEIASLFTQQGKKGTNQDAMVVWENFGSRADAVFCGVFDGHGPYGHLVARRVRDSLPLKLRAQWEANLKAHDVPKDVNFSTTGSLFSEDFPFSSAEEEARAFLDGEETENHPDVLQALKESFLKAFGSTDKELRVRSNIDCYCSGTTAVTLVKQGRDIVIGNVGDSRAILATRSENNSLTAVQLTVDLKPSLPEEAERIKKCKGRVFALNDEPEVTRVWLPNTDSPGLAMARAFGDFCLKDYGVISVPEVSHRRITHRDEFIVLASDGIWDVLPNEEVVDIVGSCPLRSQAARTLIESAVKAWKIKYPTSKVDDCAVVCLYLDSDGYTPCANDSKGNMHDATKKDELARSCAVKTAENEVVVEVYDEDLADEQTNDEIVQWTALEGVSRKDTLVDLPTYRLNEEAEEGGGGGKSRKK